MKVSDLTSTSVAGTSSFFYESANLDFLRAWAVLAVFANHYYVCLTAAGVTWDFTWRLGRLGVLIFFVHTSLVLMLSLERSNVQGQSLFTPFYVRRAFRIYPLSIVCVLFVYFFDARWTPANLWQSLTLTQYMFFRGSPTFPPSLITLWTLPLEVQMYVALPVFFLLFRHRSLKLLSAVWCVSVAVACVQPRLGPGFTIFMYMPCFLGGVIAWRIMRQSTQTQRLPGYLWPLAIAAVSAIWMCATPKYLAIFIAALGIGLGLAIPLFHEIQSSRVRTVSKIVARYSYSIYLSHFPIMAYVTNRSQFRIIPPLVIRHYARPIGTLLILVLTSVASIALYHGIEEPGIRLGRRIAQWLVRVRQPEKESLPVTVGDGAAGD
jgi:peptidoglycan/LPS O-acetylase OafA/YrhL